MVWRLLSRRVSFNFSTWRGGEKKNRGGIERGYKEERRERGWEGGEWGTRREKGEGKQKRGTQKQRGEKEEEWRRREELTEEVHTIL